jgi:hypothetical protein
MGDFTVLIFVLGGIALLALILYVLMFVAHVF